MFVARSFLGKGVVMVRVRCTHRPTGKSWLSEPMRLADALLWIAERDDCFNRSDFDIISI